MPLDRQTRVVVKWRSFKYLGALFMSEGRMECEIDRCISTVNPLYRSVMVMKELHEKAKLSIYWSVYIPSLPMVMKI